jgi:FtsZ-interacting cell division protein ZipA
MPEDNERRFYRGSARWIIIGIVAAVAVIFVVVVAFGSTLFPSAPRAGMQSETADESATSGPGHNTTMGANDPSESQEEEAAVASTPPGAEQIPDADLTFGRETSTLNASTEAQQGLNSNVENGTNEGALENPLGENITSLTGT